MGNLVLQAVFEQDSDIALLAYKQTFPYIRNRNFEGDASYTVNEPVLLDHDGLPLCDNGTVTHGISK